MLLFIADLATVQQHQCQFFYGGAPYAHIKIFRVFFWQKGHPTQSVGQASVTSAVRLLRSKSCDGLPIARECRLCRPHHRCATLPYALLWFSYHFSSSYLKIVVCYINQGLEPLDELTDFPLDFLDFLQWHPFKPYFKRVIAPTDGHHSGAPLQRIFKKLQFQSCTLI